jgi:hypothetical protein
MLMGHLTFGLLGGLAASAVAVAAGAPLWTAPLLYIGGGNAAVLLSVAVQLLTGRERPGRQPAAAVRTATELRAVRVTR